MSKYTPKTYLFHEIQRRLSDKFKMAHDLLKAYEQHILEGNPLTGLFSLQDFVMGLYAGQSITYKNWIEVQDLIRREIYNRTPQSPAVPSSTRRAKK
jgi:hypothetical protein